MTNPALGFSIVNPFDSAQVEHCRLWWRGRRQGQANLGVWSQQRTPASGKSLKFETDYLIQ